ncbi:MAG: alginate export family protein [Gammaproteobacteria bacterium]|nr:alginate export family protein [Gammaproteobacteria bacterium]
MMRIFLTALSSAALLAGAMTAPAPLQAAGANPLEHNRPLRPGAPRWLEDYRFLDDPAKRTDWFDNYRYHRLSDTAWLQLGGELRYRVDSVRQPLFGLTPVHKDNYLQQRAQFHADLHLLDDRLRTFVQLQNTRSWGKELQTPRDESRNDIHQAFIESNLELGAQRLRLRAGRQEMAYGVHALMTYAETPNIRQTYEGLRLTLSQPGGSTLDAFAVRTLRYREGNFDDKADNNTRFYGLYAALPLSSGQGIDLYATGIERKARPLLGTLGGEKRYTLGTRLHGQSNGYDWTWDLMHQQGHFAGQSIRAWGLWSESGYTFAHAWRPRLAAKLDLSTGDGDASDGRAETFDPHFPRGGVYGETGLTHPANLLLFGPMLAFSPTSQLRIEPAVFKHWRQNSNDAIYLPGLQPLPGSTTVGGREIGTNYRMNARWTPTANLTLDLDYQYFQAGSVVRKAGGQSTQFVAVRSNFRF